jgi:subtilisin family serine protease
MRKAGERALMLVVFPILVIAAGFPVSTLAQEPAEGMTVGPLISQMTAMPLMPESIVDVETKKVPPELQALRHAQQGLVSVIVKLKGESLTKYGGGLRGLPATNPRATGAAELNLRSAASGAYLRYLGQKHAAFERSALQVIPDAQFTHRFNVILNAVGMIVPADRAAELADLPDVEAVYADELRQPDTDRSPQFIGAPTAWNKLGGQGSAGAGVVVAVIDTGVWPEHPSFSDPDPAGKPYPAPPPPLSGSRQCQFSGGANPGDPFTCNNKLIGAQRLMATYDGLVGLVPGEFTTARDDDGHGTHTSSTAAGNGRVLASIFGLSRGPVSGIAPRAQVIMYKVCGASGCYSSDSAAAIQEAIVDGASVINFSISGGSNPYTDVTELAFLDAYNAGVFVAASAGNAGPGADTTDHRGPWVTTVGASTEDRVFGARATLAAGRAKLSLAGDSMTAGIATPTSVVVAPDLYCAGPYASGSFTDQVVVCARGGGPGRAQKGYNVLQGDAAGMILYNQSATVTDLETDNHYLPTIHITFAAGQALLAFLTAHPDAKVTWPNSAKGPAKGDVMASFSSRGGPDQSLGVSKPDITAPGVQILAGHSPQHLPPPEGVALGPEGELFQAIAGTSMSSPIVAGSAALLKALHPVWTPGRIKSALMTTAKTTVVKEDGVTSATPFDDGSGRVDLTKAASPGLTFDETGANYLAHQNDLWNANYPSIYLPALPGQVTVVRTAHSELGTRRCWNTSVKSLSDVKVTVVPKVICAPAGGDATFSITVDGSLVPEGQVRHAVLNLTSAGQTPLHLPISFVRNQPAVSLAKTCTPSVVPLGTSTNCAITAQNNSYYDNASISLSDSLPADLTLTAGSVAGATEGPNSLFFTGSLFAAKPPDVTIGAGSSPAGYQGLSVFGISPISGVGDETIINFNVPAFTYAGETYTRLGVVSNGYVVVGGGTGADIQFVNQNPPSTARPNNVLAPFWTDLNPGAGGAIRIATLTNGTDTWIVVDWAAVKEYSSSKTDTFEVWIGVNGDANPVEDIAFVYGTLGGNGDGGKLTVGAENRLGSRGGAYYYSNGTTGTGTVPTISTQLRVTGTAPAVGGTHEVTYQATGTKVVPWTNCVLMTSDAFSGLNASCFAGRTSAK